MTVGELIERLQNLDPEIMVRAFDENEGMMMEVTHLNVHALAVDLQMVAGYQEALALTNGDRGGAA